MNNEEFSLNADQLVEKVKQLVHEGNIRQITIKNEQGESVLVLPVTVATVGALLMPALAALGAVAALMTKCTIVVERR